jgi:hypothetical protein
MTPVSAPFTNIRKISIMIIDEIYKILLTVQPPNVWLTPAKFMYHQ